MGADIPPVVPGSHVLIQLKDRKFYTIDPVTEERGPDQWMPAIPEVKVIHDRDQCWDDDWAESYESTGEAEHTSTICPECIYQWGIDYYITLADEQVEI